MKIYITNQITIKLLHQLNERERFSLGVLQLNMQPYVYMEQIALFSYSGLPSLAPAQFDIFLMCIADKPQL